jgi:hypothetical protein
MDRLERVLIKSRPDRRKKVKLKLISGCLAVAFVVQITASDAQSVSPVGHYTKKRGGAGEMWVQKAGAEWRIFVNAGGIPRAGATAADCALIVVGTIERNTFQGEVKYELDASELDQARRKAVLDYLKGGSSKPSSDIDIEPDLMMTITFAPQSATVNDVDWGPRGPCPEHTGLFGRHTKEKR